MYYWWWVMFTGKIYVLFLIIFSKTLKWFPLPFQRVFPFALHTTDKVSTSQITNGMYDTSIFKTMIWVLNNENCEQQDKNGKEVKEVIEGKSGRVNREGNRWKGYITEELRKGKTGTSLHRERAKLDLIRSWGDLSDAIFRIHKIAVLTLKKKIASKS